MTSLTVFSVNIFSYRVYKRYPELLAEMYAYSLAGAHEALPHFSVMHHMISNTEVSDEGWVWVDAFYDDVCQPPVISSVKDPQTGIPRSEFYPNKNLPTLMHYCQFFRVGELGFQKRRLQQEIMRCDFPMLITPSLDLGKNKYKNRDGDVRLSSSFVNSCHLIFTVNKIADYLQSTHVHARTQTHVHIHIHTHNHTYVQMRSCTQTHPCI